MKHKISNATLHCGNATSRGTAVSHGNVTSRGNNYFHKKHGHLTREISRIAMHVHMWKNEVTIERYYGSIATRYHVVQVAGYNAPQ